jgi:uncharacterized membrane protein YhaH (DUF805 family)
VEDDKMAGENLAFLELMNGNIMSFIAAFFMISLVIAIVMYIFVSLAFMAIAKKAKLSTPGLAWIPGVGPGIIIYQASKMHWWPWLLLIGSVIPVVNLFALIAFGIMNIIWTWKTFEAIQKPGWWAILLFVPIVNIVIIAIAAWSK